MTTTQTRLSGPISGGTHGWPFGAATVDVAQRGYVEEEFFLAGDATVYRVVPGTEQTPDGRWQAEPDHTVPYATRIVVRRPQDPARFNGTVFVQWNNVTAGYELFGGESPVLFDGFAWVGVSAQVVGVHGFSQDPHGLVAWDEARYGSLSIPTDDASYDIFTQAGRAVAPDRPRSPIDPMGGLEVQRIIATGGSQSAARLATYINPVHPLAGVFDAFLPTIYFGTGTPLQLPPDYQRPAALGAGGSAAAAMFRAMTILRTDLGVPVFVLNSETETERYAPVRQPDTDQFRFWEIAGVAHTGGNPPLSFIRYRREWGTERPVAETKLPPNTNPLAPTEQAVWLHLHRWLSEGTPPPTAPRIEVTGDPPQVVRDEDGNARGGVRLPQLEAPVATFTGSNEGPALAHLQGSRVDFSPTRLRELYPDHASYVARFSAAAQRAVQAGWLLERDAEEMIREAVESAVP